VTRLPFLRLNPVALDRLGLVANWAALAVDNARTHERTRARTIQDDLIRAYTYAYYRQRLEEEEARAARYDRPLSVLIFRIRQLELIPSARRAELGHVLSLVFNHSLRDVDIVCRYATDDAFAVILPETGAEGAAVVGARIEREIAAFQFAPYADEDRDLEFTVRVLPVREPGQGTASGQEPRQ
jgi:diguanylate cyclase (GGDEF)-like protein